jgi:cytochrome P450
MNYNEAVFTSPRKFMPSRWLSEDPKTLSLLEDCWSPFSKGSRGCMGKNLAMAEIYITIAVMARAFSLERMVDRELALREVFGVIYDKPVRMVFSNVID